MALKYTNRVGENYYFKAIPTKKGRLRYYTTKIEDDCQNINEIPNGFEIYETPEDAIVVLRLIVKKLFTENEISVIEKSIAKTTNLKYSLIDVRENCLTVFVGNRNGVDLGEWDENYKDFMIKTQAYHPKMRIIKTKNEFIIQRRCYLGSMDDWIEIDRSEDLESLSLIYCYHLNKESFFELFEKQ